MTFSELSLIVAIHRLQPGSKDYVTQEQRMRFAMHVQRVFCYLSEDSFFPYHIDDVIGAYMKYRKSSDTQVKAAIADTHGTRCFWKDRGKGYCSDEVEAGHLVADSHGGALSVENCIIECRAHNNQRRAMTIEEYLISELTSDVVAPVEANVPY